MEVSKRRSDKDDHGKGDGCGNQTQPECAYDIGVMKRGKEHFRRYPEKKCDYGQGKI